MSLHPPSFFSAPRLEQKKSDPLEDEVAVLKGENIALKTSVKHQLSSPGSNVQPLLVSSTPPAILTSDLLQVEGHLQSRVRLLECERNELVREVEKGKLLLSQREERCVAELAEIKLAHKEAIKKVQLDREKFEEEQNNWREENRERTNTLQTQLINVQQHHREQVDELSARIQQLEQANSALTVRLEEESRSHDLTTSQLKGQLVANKAEKEALREELDEKISHLSNELEFRVQKVNELESYLGGEIPIIKEKKSGKDVTWKDERETLLKTLYDQKGELERVTSENKLVNIRLSSISEILSLQEAELAKGFDANDNNSQINALLTRWREKVFVLLFQQKVKQIEDLKAFREQEKEQSSLLDQLAALQREVEKLSHTLTDRTAELQLETTKRQYLQEELGVVHTTRDQLETQLTAYITQNYRLKANINKLVEQFSTHRAVFAQALTKVTSLGQRITFATSRLNSIAVSLSCKMAVLHSSSRHSLPGTEFGCQTDPTEEPDSADLSSFTREQLENEMACLMTERDTLVCQLRESTQSFQQQLAELDTTSGSKLSLVEGALKEANKAKSFLEKQLTELRTLHHCVEEERDSLSVRVEEVAAELAGVHATLETRIDTAIKKQRQESLSELTDMEALVNVARREHSKAVVQLQQLQRQLDRDKHRAVEAVELSKAKVEHELECCKKKLNAALVERNLVMTTLRQEGIALPRRATHKHDNKRDSRSSSIGETNHDLTQNDLEATDFKAVIKDLQTLSASLLEIDK